MLCYVMREHNITCVLTTEILCYVFCLRCRAGDRVSCRLMPRGPGRDSWAHGWFDAEGQCRHVGADGVRCSCKLPARNVTARATHLDKQHSVTTTTPLPKVSGMKTLEQAWADKCPQLDEDDVALVFLAEKDSYRTYG